MTTTVDTSNREMVITRLLNAPRELVWKAWTSPEHVKNWWGPDGFTNTIHEMEVKPGGTWRYIMHGPGGMNFPNKIVFNEIQEPERLVYTHSADVDDDPDRFETTVTFEEKEGKTWLTMRALFPTAEEKQRVINEFGALEGGKQTLNKLEQYLETMGMEPFSIEREYNAPVEKVWQALTNAEEMKQWYFELAEFNAEPGFEFSFYGQGLKGENYLHLCKVTDVVPGRLLRYSWTYDKYPGLSFVTFELFPLANKTRLKLTHEGLETFATDNPDFVKENFVKGWTEITGTSLKNYLESKK